MSDEPKEPRRHRKATWIVATALVVVFVLYPLSVGPAAWLNVHGYISNQTFLAAYLPLAQLAFVSRPFNSAVGWYMDLWRVNPALRESD